MPQQICQSCQKNIATVHEYVVKSKEENHLCEECYQKLHLHKSGPVVQIELLQKLFLSGNIPGKAKARKDLVCKGCGLKLSDFKRQAQCGCEECYQTFRKQMVPLLENVHESVTHVGTSRSATPPDSPAKARHLRKNLERELEELIRQEKYEEAAAIRDQLKGLEEESEETP